MTMQKDPVCGMDVDPQNATWIAEHKGETYYFCGKGCMLEFRDDPERYLDPGHQPSMEGGGHGHGHGGGH